MNSVPKTIPITLFQDIADVGFFLGGKFEPCVRSQTDDIIKVGALVSVRLYKHGINLRTFVDLNQNKVMPTKIKVIK